jgi:hypothetical protein
VSDLLCLADIYYSWCLWLCANDLAVRDRATMLRLTIVLLSDPGEHADRNDDNVRSMAVIVYSCAGAILFDAMSRARFRAYEKIEEKVDATMHWEMAKALQSLQLSSDSDIYQAALHNVLQSAQPSSTIECSWRWIGRRIDQNPLYSGRSIMCHGDGLVTLRRPKAHLLQNHFFQKMIMPTGGEE